MLSLRFFSQLLLIPLSLWSLQACTIYRSDGRNNFESVISRNAASQSLTDKTTASFGLIQCQKESRLQTWLQEEFPKQNYTLVLSETDLEIWSVQKSKSFEVRVRQKNEDSTQACTYEFADEKTWERYQEQFVFEMRNNLLISE